MYIYINYLYLYLYLFILSIGYSSDPRSRFMGPAYIYIYSRPAYMYVPGVHVPCDSRMLCLNLTAVSFLSS